jgi:hypothetical protein
MDPLTQNSILSAFTETQKWSQQFIVEDSGQLVDLSSACLKHSPTTPDNAQNQPTTYPDRSVYRFDSTKFKGKDSFDSLLLMIQNSLCGGKFSFVRGSKNNRYILWCSHSRLQERNQSKVHIFKEDKYGQEGVKEVSVKRKSSRVISSIDAMAGKQESKLRKISMSSTVSQYSNNQPSHRRVHSIRKSDKNDCCKCRVAFFLWPDGYYYLDHKTTNIDHNGHPQFTPHSKLKGITYLNDESKLLFERMSAVGVRPSQLSILLEMLDDSDGRYQASTVRNIVQKCELLRQKELGIDHNMSSAEKAMEFLTRLVKRL